MKRSFRSVKKNYINSQSGKPQHKSFASWPNTENLYTFDYLEQKLMLIPSYHVPVNNFVWVEECSMHANETFY